MKKFNLFLILALSLTAFLAGYLFVKDGFSLSSDSKTGTILDKFGEPIEVGDTAQEADKNLPFLVADRQVTAVSNSLNKQSVLYFEKNTGKIFEFNLVDKKERVISDTVTPNFISAAWSPNKKETISSYYNPSRNEHRFKNYDTVKDSQLSKDIRSFAFSPDGNLIAYYLFENIASSSSGKIMLSQPNGDYPKKILDTRILDLKIAWTAKDQIILKTPLSEIFLMTEDGKLVSFMDSRILFREKWSLSGKKMLFSAVNDYDGGMEPILSIKDVASREEKSLGILGSAHKCVWSIDDVNIYCALSKTPTEDEVYLINTGDNTKKLITEPGIAIKELFLSDLEDYILYTAASNEKLFGIKVD